MPSLRPRLVFLLVLLSAFWPQALTSAATVNVGIYGTSYHPSFVILRPGDTVTWQLQPGVTPTSHTVTANDGSFGSPVLCPTCTETGFSHTFTTPGTYAYHCMIHPQMTGLVTVTAGSPPPSPTPSTTPSSSPAPPPSPTPSRTPPPSPRPTPSPSRSPSPTPSPSPSPPATPSPSPSPAFSSTVTAVAGGPTSGGGGLSTPAVVAIVAGLVALGCGVGLILLRRSGAW